MDEKPRMPQALSEDEIEIDFDNETDLTVEAALAAANLRTPYTGTQDGNSDNDVA